MCGIHQTEPCHTLPKVLNRKISKMLQKCCAPKLQSKYCILHIAQCTLMGFFIPLHGTLLDILAALAFCGSGSHYCPALSEDISLILPYNTTWYGRRKSTKKSEEVHCPVLTYYNSFTAATFPCCETISCVGRTLC